MDVVRARPVFLSTVLVVGLVLSSVLIYFIFKGSDENRNNINNVNDENKVNNVTKVHIVSNVNNLNENKEIPTGTISDYNPLEDEGFKRIMDWGEFRTHGSLSASAADFQKDEECRRVVVFFGRGVILGHILTACDSVEPSMGLLMVDDILYYYGRAMEIQGPDDTFTVAKKVIGERRCLLTDYTVDGGDRPKLIHKSDPIARGYNDKNCKILINFKMPHMLLLSRNGVTGSYVPTKPWATINPWEPLGAVTRMYWNGARCFRLLTITSYGRSLQSVKVSCGPVENVVITDHALYYGDALVVRRNTEADRFDLIYNPKRSGECFKKTVELSSKEGRTVISIKSKEKQNNQDEQCLKLVSGEIPEAVVSKDKVSLLIGNLELDRLGVDPYEARLKDYDPYTSWNYFNLHMDLGFAMRYYMTKEGFSIRKLLLVIARGVPIAATLVDPGPLQRLVMRDDVLYVNTTIMLKKAKAANKFTALVKVDEYNCFKKSYVLKTEGGVTSKEELPSGGQVTKSMDEDCLDLIEGRKLKNADLGKYGHETDEAGVPTDFSL